MHPNYRMWLVGGARHLAAELNLVDWLEAKQIDYDVITDEDLHYEGAELLAHYKVIMKRRLNAFRLYALQCEC